MENRKSDQTPTFGPLNNHQLQQVSGGCHLCQPQIYAPSSLSAFAPSMHLADSGASLTANFQQPADYFRVF